MHILTHITFHFKQVQDSINPEPINSLFHPEREDFLECNLIDSIFLDCPRDTLYETLAASKETVKQPNCALCDGFVFGVCRQDNNLINAQ